MKYFFWLLKKSIILDIKFWEASSWSITKKIQFLLKKYFLLVKMPFRKFILGSSKTRLFGEDVYYNSMFGLADYQSILTHHQNMLRIAGLAIKPKMIVDIGANVGFFTKMVRGLYPETVVYSVEPVPDAYACLKSNFKKDLKVIPSLVAISDCSGEAMMAFNDQSSTISAFNEKGNLRVKTVTLDQFIQQNNIKKIDILKIDTETFENKVLGRAQKALSITKYLFIEIAITGNKNYTVSYLLSLLYSINYNFQLVAFRNYADTGEGEMPVMDALFVNKHIVKN